MIASILRSLAALALVLCATGAHAAYPDQPITMIVPFPAGGGADAAARLMGRHLERKLGQPVVILNRGGAGGEIGFTAIARARPDGYTIGIVTLPNAVVLPIQRQAQYRLADLAPIANLVEDTGVFFVRKDSRFQTLADLVAAAKAKPDGVNMATIGNGSFPHMAQLLLQKKTGIRMTPIPYSGTTPIRQAILAGDVDLGFVTIADIAGDLQGGTVRALAQTGDQRAPNGAQIPTAREQGTDLVFTALRGFAAPAQTPAAIVRTLSDAMAEIVRTPEFQADARTQSMALRFIPAPEFQRELERQDTEYRALWRVTPWEK